VGGFERGVHRVREFVADRSEVHGVLRSGRERAEYLVGVVAGPVGLRPVGLRPVGPDVRPPLGLVDGVSGLVVATGLGASGLTMGPYAGAIAARSALGLPQLTDLAPFDPLRS
jgi:glycine/D-amino acid oxidase-like deaminating enzyme